MKPFIRKYWQPSVLPLSLLVDTTMISISKSYKTLFLSYQSYKIFKTLTSKSRVITISYESIAGFFRMHAVSFSRCIQPAITQQFLKDVALSGKQVEVN